jgi:hypothetical protein
MFTQEEIKKYIISAVKNSTSDNLERANMQFGRMSQTQIDKEYGQSGRTCREIWGDWKQERELNHAALRLLNNIL